MCVQLGREVLDIAAAAVRVGVTAEEVDRVVHEVCVHVCMCIGVSSL